MSLDMIGEGARTWVETGLRAIGSVQANAFALRGNTQNEFTTVGPGTGCILPMAYPSPPSQISVFNAGSNALAVYPPLGGTINDGTVNAPYLLAAGTGLTYWASSLSNWYLVQTPGSGTVNAGTAGQLAIYRAGGAAISGVTQKVLYASQYNVPTINPASPQAGTAATSALQAILNSMGAGTLVIDVPVRASGLVLSSGQTLAGLGSFSGSEPIAGIWMDTCTSATEVWYVATNKHWVSSYQGSTIVDQDITVRDLYINGLHGSGSSGTANFQNPQGDWVVGVAFIGVKNLRMENVFVYDPCSYHYYCINIDHGTFRNLYCLDPVTLAGPTANRHTDGLHFIGPINDILVDGLFGTTGDDFLALNCCDGNVSVASSTSNQQSNWANAYYGNGTRIVARNLFPVGCAGAVRLATGTPTGGSTPNTISQVLIDGITGSLYQDVLQMSTVSGAGGGYFDVTFQNLTITPIQQSVLSAVGFWFNQDTYYSNFSFKNIKFTDLPASGNPVTSFILAQGNIDRLEIDGLSIIEDSGETATPDSPIQIGDLHVGTLTLRDCFWQRNSFTDIALITMTNGIVTAIEIKDVSTSNVQHIASITGGTVGDVLLSGVVHGGNASNAAVNVGSGVTVGRLRSAATDVYQLWGGAGTVSSLATDGTSGISPDPAAPVAGDSWFSANAGSMATCRFVDSSNNRLITLDDGTFFRCTNCTALANSTTQATLLGSPTSSWGSLAIPAGALKAGQWIEIEIQTIGSTSGAPNLQVFVLFGGTTIIRSAAGVAVGTNISGGAGSTWGPIKLQARSVGSSGSMNGACTLRVLQANLVMTTFSGGVAEAGSDVTGINFNTLNMLDFRAQWGTASASNTIQMLAFTARIRG